MATRTITGTALLLALGVVLPILFHAFPYGGRMLLPMHIPVMIAGLLLGPIGGLAVGAGAPILSTLLTGMPPVPLMVPMVFELATYGLVAGLLRRYLAQHIRGSAPGPATTAVHGRGAASRSAAGRPWILWFALLITMVTGRLVWMAVVTWLAPAIGITSRSLAVALGALGAGWPGIVVQLALVPPIVHAIERSRRP